MATLLGDLARIVTSKNAGPYRLTIDVFFDEPAKYERARRSKALTAERIARAYGLELRQVRLITYSDAALGVKITLERQTSADDFHSTDTYGAQQHMPIAELMVNSHG